MAKAKAKAAKAAKAREKASEAKALEKMAKVRMAKEKVRGPWMAVDVGHVAARAFLGSALGQYSNKVVERKVERRDRCDIFVG